MLNNASVMDRSDTTTTAGGGALPRASDLDGSRLCAKVDPHEIGLKLLPNTWIWDVQKRRAVSVAYLVGQHASRDSARLQRCTHCAAIGEVLQDLMSRAVPPQGNGCRHMIGTTRAEDARDDLAQTVHQVCLPVVFIHRAASSNDELYSLRCLADFRSHLQRFGVSELAFAEIAERAKV